jgi:hypothetical protein
VLDEQARFFQTCVSPNGFESGGGLSPVGSSPLSEPAIQEINAAGKERKKDESADFKNVEQIWSFLSAQEVANRGGHHHKKVNNSALAARVSYADRVRFPETNPGCNPDYGAVANHECNSGWTPG